MSGVHFKHRLIRIFDRLTIAYVMRIFLSRWIYSLSPPTLRSHYGAIFRECAITDAEEIHCSIRASTVPAYTARVCVCVCVHLHTKRRAAERGTHQHLRSTDLIIVSLYLSRTLSRKQKRGIDVVHGCAKLRVYERTCCSGVATYTRAKRKRGEDEVSRGGNARETPGELRREQWRIHRGAKSSADDNTA